MRDISLGWQWQRRAWSTAGLAMWGWSLVAWAQTSAVGGNSSVGPVAVVAAGLPAAPFAVAESDGSAMVSAEWAASAGRDALRAGLPNLAKDFFRQALDEPGIDATTRDALNLDLATAWLALDDVDNATLALKAVGTQDTAPYALRAALLASRTERWPEAAAQLARITPGNLSTADQPWLYLVQALLAEEGKDAAAAQAAWQRARAAATTPLQAAQFEAAQFRGQMILTGEITAEQEAALKQSYTDFLHQTAGVEFAKEYAIILYKHDPSDPRPAIAVVTQLLSDMPDEDHDGKDSVRLLLALLAPKSADSQARLKEVLENHPDNLTPEERLTQEIALALLESNMDQDPAGLQKFLGDLVESPRRHPLLDQLYLLQAQLYSKAGRLDDASASAQQLLEQFPGSPAQPEALRLLAYIAWSSQPPRYRTAADYLSQLRSELPEGTERTRLAGLLADLYYLNGDYQDAAESYAALLGAANPPLSPGPGTLFQRAVQSDILAAAALYKAGRADDAGRQLDAALQLDETAANKNIPSMDRWYAEWDVLSALRDHDRAADAFKHLDELLSHDQTVNALPADLRLRLRWLAARLAVDVTDPSAVARAQALQADLDALPAGGAPGIDPAMLTQLKAQALLLQGQAAYFQGQTADYERFFKELSQDYEGSDAAIYSIFFEAQALAAAGQTAKAQDQMNEIAARYEKSEYAPLALYESALYAEARGEASEHQNALAKLSKFAATYPDNPLLYQVLLLQGDIERKSNNFKPALDVYDLLLSKWPDNPDRPRAELDKAACLAGLAGQNQDLTLRDQAEAQFEQLLNRPALSVAARAEAGFELGYMLAQSQSTDEAAQVYFSVVSRFINDPALAGGQIWISKCIFELADLYEKKNQFEPARRLYEQVLEHGLPGQALAQARLESHPAQASAAAVSPGA